MKNTFFALAIITFGVVSAPQSRAQTQPVDVPAVQAARDAAVSAGADSRYPEPLAALDALLTAAKNDAKKLQDVLLRYQALEQVSTALSKKDRADGLNFSQYNLPSYQAGEKAIAAFEKANKAKASTSSLTTTAKTADDSYAAVLFAGFTAQAVQERVYAAESKAKADGAQAAVAVKDIYAKAENSLNAGDTNVANSLPEAALADFKAARASYEESFENVEKRKEEATQAIAAAEERVVEADAFAADAAKPLGAAIKKRAEEYRVQSRAYNAQAKEVFETVDYTQTIELAHQAAEQADLSSGYIKDVLAKPDADVQTKKAKSRVAAVERINAPENFPEEYSQASAELITALSLYAEEKYAGAAVSARHVIELLSNIRAPLPAYYDVRSWSLDKDCLWNIAAKEGVYSNARFWERLYSVNKSALGNDPNMLKTGTRLTIPVIAGETREGAYDPDQIYDTGTN